MYQTAQDQSLKRKKFHDILISLPLPIQAQKGGVSYGIIHFILPTGIIAYAFLSFKYSRFSNISIYAKRNTVPFSSNLSGKIRIL